MTLVPTAQGPDPAAPAAGPADARTTFEYDVFLSYSDPDEPWVVAELLGPLEQAGVKVIHKLEFLGGIPKAEARSQAVKSSRHTIVVLSEDWCRSEWDSLDASLVGTLDPGARYRRLLPLKLKDCRPPEQIEQLTTYDFTNPGQRREVLARLLRQLGLRQEAINEQVTRTARKGITALCDILTGQAAAAILGVGEAFQRASKKIDVLERDKRLHELFHRVEDSYKLVRGQRRLVVREDDDWDELDQAVRDMATPIEVLLDYARSAAFRPPEVQWADRLSRARSDTLTGVTRQDIKLLDKALQRVHQILCDVPPQLNKDMRDAAREVGLEEIVLKLRSVECLLEPNVFDTTAGTRVEDFKQGIQAISRLDASLNTFITNHNCLQEVDGILRVFDDTRKPDPQDVADVWPDLEGPLELLSVESGAIWVLELRLLKAELDKALADPGALAGAAAAVKKVHGLLREFRPKVNEGFMKLDVDLLTFCGQLQKVNDSLKDAIRKMQDV